MSTSIDCVSAGEIAFRSPMKSPLHNMNHRKCPAAKRAIVAALAMVAITSAGAPGQEPTLSGPSFIPDGRASSLAGWHTLGKAAWRADQGEIAGNGANGSGWLVLDHASRRRTLHSL
jgi:hypothetical protein